MKRQKRASLGIVIIAICLYFASGQSSLAEAFTVLDNYQTKSALGYDLPVPLAALKPQEQSALRNELPLAAIGRLAISAPPYHVTTVYLGKFRVRGTTKYLFSCADHALTQTGGIPLFVKFASTGNIPVESKAVFESAAGDLGILVANLDAVEDAAQLNQITESLDSIAPIPVLFEPLWKVILSFPNAHFAVAGIAKRDIVTQEFSKIPKLWTAQAIELWNNSETIKEAKESVAIGPVANTAGDVLVVAETRVLAGGRDRAITDPDGLQLNQITVPDPSAGAFLASPVNWKPDSIAATLHTIGRMSGSPLLMCLAHSGLQELCFMVGSDWTDGLPKDVQSLIPLAEKTSAAAFGNINIVPTIVQKNGVATAAQAFQMTTVAPFSYLSAVSTVGRELDVQFHFLQDGWPTSNENNIDAVELFYYGSLINTRGIRLNILD